MVEARKIVNFCLYCVHSEHQNILKRRQNFCEIVRLLIYFEKLTQASF